MGNHERKIRGEAKQMVTNAFKNKSKKRILLRKEQRELDKLQAYFDKYCNGFAEVLLGVPWDDGDNLLDVGGEYVRTKDVDPFTDFNNGWVKYCASYNAKKHHKLEADNQAFHSWAISQDVNVVDDVAFNFGQQTLLTI